MGSYHLINKEAVKCAAMLSCAVRGATQEEEREGRFAVAQCLFILLNWSGHCGIHEPTSKLTQCLDCVSRTKIPMHVGLPDVKASM